MGYKVIHMIEAAEGLDEVEYSRLVEQCRQIFRFLSGTETCKEQVCMTFSDKVKEIQTGNREWPGEAAFRRPRHRKKSEESEKKVCFEAALHAASVHMQKEEEWIVILYTAGAVKRSKRTMLNKWKKTLKKQPILLAVKTEFADGSFLESFTDADRVFSSGNLEKVFQWIEDFGKASEEGTKTPKERRKKKQEITELWKIVRDCFEGSLSSV